MAKKKKKTPTTADYGPPERQQHGEYVEVETSVAGVKAIRNVTVDPITTYHRRGSISQEQWQAADHFAGHYRTAALAVSYSHVRFGHTPGGQSDEFLERVNDTKRKIRAALKHVGNPLASVIEHVAGNDLTAGTWSGVKNSKRPNVDGMVALRLALDGLAEYYNMR
jgi:hypothetical protein